MSTFETLKAFFSWLVGGERERERTKEGEKEQRNLWLQILKVASTLGNLRGWGRLAGTKAVNHQGCFDSPVLGIT